MVEQRLLSERDGAMWKIMADFQNQARVELDLFRPAGRPAQEHHAAPPGSFAMARMHFRFRRFVSGVTLFTYVIRSRSSPSRSSG